MRALIHSTFGEASDVLDVVEVPLPEPGPGQVRVRTVLSPIHNHDCGRSAAPTATSGAARTVGDRGGRDRRCSRRRGRDAPRRAAGRHGRNVRRLGGVLRRGRRCAHPGAGCDRRRGGRPARGDAVQCPEPPRVPRRERGRLDRTEHRERSRRRLVAQFAPARGVRVLGLVRRAAGVDELAAAGIGNVVATDDTHWRERAAELLEGAAPRAAVDSVGGSAAGDLLSLLGEGGTLVSFGAMGSPTLQLASGDLIFTQATVKGFWGSKVSQDMDAATRGRLFGELLERVGSGSVASRSRPCSRWTVHATRRRRVRFRGAPARCSSASETCAGPGNPASARPHVR